MRKEHREPRVLIDLDFVWGDTRYVVLITDSSTTAEWAHTIGALAVMTLALVVLL